MSRALRILFEGAYYHVMNRGAGSSDIFIDEKDYKTFLKTAEEACGFFNVQILAYCLMTTHYHLLVHTPEGNLPRFMRHVNGVYTQRRNQRYKTNGSIFKGRYLAIIVQDEEYLLKCMRYIHLNPVKAGLVNAPNAQKPYLWSSHNDYLKMENKGRWLDIRNLLNRFGPSPEKARDEYLKFLSAGNDAATEQFYQMQKISSIFGPEKYADDIKQKYIHSKRIYDFQEIPEAKRIKYKMAAEKIFQLLLRELNVTKEDVLRSVRRKGNLPKQIAVSLLKDLTHLPSKEIADTLRLGSYKTISTHLYRFREKLKGDKKLAKLYQDLVDKCRSDG